MTKTKKKTPKLFILDTNVVLHDSRCIRNFQENDIAIPMTVLEELDNFKRGNELINFHARDFLRQMDELTGDVLFADGVQLGPDLGRLRIIVGKESHPDLKQVFFEDTPDNRILNALYSVSKTETEHRVILVSKDTNLRMKAKSLGLAAQDYTTDKIKSIDKIFTGKRLVENVSEEAIDALYKAPFQVTAALLPEVGEKIANENFILRNGQKSALATYHQQDDVFVRVDKEPAYGIMPRNAEQTFALKALIDDQIPLVTLSGKAGTGKTLLALAGALACSSGYRQIFLARPIVPLSNRDLGFLPGDIKSKIDPYMQPLFDNLTVIRHQFNENDSHVKKISDMMDNDKLLITPLAFIRGRSFQKVYFIVDEAQNLTPHEVKTIITRAGEGTKFVFTGDIYQIDHPYLDTLSNGLSYMINRMKGQPAYAHITLEKGERSALAELASNLL
ncbi:MAG: PhoH family protein [Candidatus Neomarinimicrobiota bacterium]